MTDSAPPQDRLAGLSREQRAHLFEQIRRRKEKERATGPPDRIPRRPPGLDPIPLSFAQERLWFIDRLQPGLTVYNVPQALLIAGEISPAVFAAVLGEVVRRHEALRTTFREVDGRPGQVIAPAGGWTLPLVDLSGLPAGLREARARRLAQEEAERPFDLERGPLLRATLLRLAPAGHALLLDMHHIVSDGWSIGVLVGEIMALYGAAATGAPSPLPELPVQYADFAVWQREWLRGEELARQLSYWREALAGAPASLELPADRPLPAERTYAGGRLHAPFGPAFTRDLALLARRHEATPFMVLLAGFQALLGRMTGSEDLTVGSPIANRNRTEIEPLIGFFVNTLVLRGDLAGDPTFRELIGRVRKTTLEAYSHQDLPFEQLVEELKPERRLAANPLFQVLFAVQNAPRGAIDLPGLSLAPLKFDIRVVQFDLELSFWDLAEGLAADLVYSTELFDPATALRLAAHLETLLHGLMADPGRRVSEAPLLSVAERQQLVREWNDTGREIAGVPLAHGIVARQAALTPDAVAVEHGEERLSYRELAARAGRLAGVLRAAGVGADVPVALWVGRSLALPVGVLAVLEAGGACLPLDPSYPAERLALMIADAGPRLVVAEEGMLGELPTGLDAVVLDERGETAAAVAGSELEPMIDPDHLAYILYTSGSTGRPKGVALTHRAVVNIALWACSARPERGRRVLQFSPLSFDVSFEEMLSTWASGGTLVLMPEEMRRDPNALLDFLIEKRIERLFQPFVALQQLAEAAREQGRTPPDLRELITAGEQLRVTPAVAALCQGGARLFNEYGPTETHVTTAFLLRGEPGGWPALPPIGRPIANHRILLLDRGRLPVPLGLPGELCIGGAGLARGYFRRPDLTADRFIPDPGGTEPSARLYRTGDLARWTAGGDLEYLGRTDFQVKVRGYRVEPGEVEAAVAAHPGVRDAAVVARQDPPGGLRLVAYVVWDGEGSSEAGLREALKARLPAAMVPAAFVELAALPLTPSGKVDRRALAGPAFAPQGAAAATGYVEPATDTQRELAAIWSEILGVERVGAGADFFDLGGHSLLAVQVLSRLRDRLGVELPVRALFEAPTLADLARRADTARGGTGAPPPMSRRGLTEAPLSFAQTRLWFLDRLEPGSTAYTLPLALRMGGELSPAALAAVLGEVVRRHEALRTTFGERGGEPVQVIAPACLWTLPLADLGSLPAYAREAEALRLAQAGASRPFDLERGPLFRASLLRLGAAEHVLLLDIHHIVADGWSLGVLVKEITALYGAALARAASPLPELPVQYADFAVWQRGWLRGEELARQLSYWREALAGAPASLELPADRPLPAERSYAGGRLHAPFGPAFTRGLAQLARRHEATPFMVLLAGFQALLARMTGSEDLTVGSPIANRNRAEIEPLIGFFVNTLVLRGDLAGDPTFRELIGRVRKTTLEAYSHQDLPFEQLVEELKPERRLAVNPLFQVLFAVQNAPMGAIDLPGLSFAPLELDTRVAKLDLELSFRDLAEEMVADLVYSTERFDPATALRLAGHLEILLHGLMADPGRRISEAPLLSAAEWQQLVREWNPGPVALDRGPSVLHRRFEAQVDRAPEALAVSVGTERLAYGELDRRANQLARHLQASGARPGDRVALLLERSAEMVVAILAVLKTGAAYVPLDPAYPAERLTFTLEDSGASLLVTDGDRMLAAVRTVRLDAERDGIEDRSGERLEMALDPDLPAYIIYTSGSTGRPKGVVISHANVDRLFTAADRWFGFGADDVWTLFHSYAFDFSVWELWGALLHGGRLVVVPYWESRSPGDFYRLVRDERVTVLNQTPSAFRQLLWAEEATLGGAAPGLALRYVIFGGEALEPASLAPWFARHGDERPRLVNMYGITETTVHVTYRPVRAADLTAGSLIGEPIPDLAVHLLDGFLQPVPIGTPGEIHAGGAGLAQGYLGRPDLTAERFVPNFFSGEPGARLYRSGDLARRLPDGDLEYLGRIDQQVKIRGFRIELGEIEAALTAQAGVREAVVLARGGRLVAYLSGEATDPAVLRHALAERLPDYMLPAAFVFLDALPLTENGKIDRLALPEPEAAASPGKDRAPRTSLERLLAGQFREVLGLPAGREIGIDDDFFALGGHSLLAAQLVSRVRETFGVEVSLRTVFGAPTVATLAPRLEPAVSRSAATGAPPPLVPRPAGEPAPLSFGQERLWFLDRMEPGNTAFNMGSSLRLRGRLDPRALERAVDRIVRRHEALRATFIEVGGRPLQRTLPSLRVPLSAVDLSALAAAARETEAERVARASLAAPFDLEAGPLVRTSLLRLAPDLHLFLLDVHHIVSDGWSAGVMNRELIVLYDAFRAGEPSPLPPLPIQYGDFARWQREWLTGEALETQLAYWRGKLGGNLAPLDLPTDRPRPPVQTFRGGSLDLAVAEPTARALRRLSREQGASLFMTLLAAFQALLSRLSGQEDVVVGSPIAGRRHPETEGLIGFFLNTLALRTDLSGNPTFRELLARVRETTLGSYEHQDIPFEALLAELKPERDLSRTPVFQVFLNMLNFPSQGERLPDLEVEWGPAPAPESKFDLTFYVGEALGTIQVHLVYNAELFDPPRMAELLRQYRRVLEWAARDADGRIQEVSLVTPEAAAVLPDPSRPLPAEGSEAVHQRFLARARRHPDRPAAADIHGVWTWGDLDAASGRLAARLVAAGIGAAEPVAVWAHRAAPLAAALVGVLRAGAAFVVLDPAYPPARLAAVVSRAKPRAWVEVPGAEALPAEVEAALAGAPRLRVEGPGLPVDPAAPCAAVHPDAPAWIAFTSGSTGEPKGIVGSHRPLSHFLGWHERTFGLGEGDRFSLLSGLAHDPLLRDVFAPLWVGGELRVPDPERAGEPEWLAGWFARERITVTHLTPAMARLLAIGETAEPLSALRLICSGGDVLTGDDVARLRRIAPWALLVNFYGATETPQAMGWKLVEPEAPRVSLGRGIDGVDLLVLGRSGEPAGLGELGEIGIRTPYLALGYLGDPAATAERFVPAVSGRLYRTGDLGRHEMDGAVTYAGRADRQIKIRGFRIEPAEIEAAINRLPGVRESVVVTREEQGDRYLAAYVVPGPGVEPELAGRLRAFLAARLPDFMVPAAFVELPALPVTPNGKVDRRALPAPRRQVEAGAAPRSPVEERLAGLWADLLRLEGAGIHDNFFALGGHSLLAAQLVSRLREAFQVELPLRTIFEAPTIAGLAARIEQARPAAGGPAVAAIPRTSRERPLPLSFAQERLWFLQLLEPASPVYNMMGAVRLAGRLAAGALAAVLSEILRRHEALRTTFRPTATGAVQEIQPWAPLPQPRVDLSALPAEVRSGEARRIAGEAGARPFDLERGPLLRALLLRLADEDHVALWSTHHIAADGWSLSAVFVPELTRLYAAFVEGRPSPLPELPVQYADYAVWQREWLRGEILAGQLGYWRRQLASLAPLELPADRPRPPVPSGRGGSRSWELPAGPADALSRLARAADATLFMALFAAFAAVLHRETGAAELPVGMPVANRSRSEIEGLIGFFVNTLVLRGDLAGDPDLPALLARSRDTVLGALSHQDIPFERLVDELALPRNPHRPPLLRVTFQLQTAPADGYLELPGLTLAPFETAVQAAKFDLVVNLFEAGEGIFGLFQYDADLFDAATIARLSGHFTTLLTGWIDEPGTRLSDLPLLTAAERHQLLVEWNPGPALPDRGRRCLHRLFEAQVDRAPEALALSALTYGELDRRANRLARHLQTSGVRPGDRVALLLERSAEMVVAILAVLKTGAAYVPLDPAYPAERLAFTLEDSGASLLVTDGDRMLAAVRTVRLDAERDGIEGWSGERLEIPLDPDLPAYVIYTSGSTGRPKGVVVSHASVGRLFTATAPWFGFGTEDVWTLFHSYAFDFSVWELWGALLHGGRLVVVPYWESRSPEDFHRLLRDERVTVLNQTPSAFRQLLRVEEAELALRYVIFGGEALEPASLGPWFARHGDEQPRLVNMYGITETTVHVTYRPLRVADLAAGSRIGEPIPDLAVHLLDASLQLVPIGTPGEIHVGGAGLAQGYLDRPDLTAERFVPDPFAGQPGARLYRSGDLARRLPDGDLEYLGRIDQQVKIRGFRIELGEIEAALAAQAGVREAVVLARDGRLVAYLSGEAADPAVLRRSLAERLPDYMLPAAFVFLDALPLTENGKIDRRALPAPEAVAAPEKDRVKPRTPLERFLVDQFREVLGLPAEREIGIDEDFFDLGGHSLLATQLVSRVREAFQVELPLRKVFEASTAAGLAAWIEPAWQAASGPATPPVVRVPRDRPLPLSFAQERLWFLHLLAPESPVYNLGASVWLAGRLDAGALAAALSEILRRHEALRTTFRATATGAVQEIHAWAPQPQPLIDLATLPEEVRQQEARRIAGEEGARPFDLERGPLLRSLLLRLGEEEHVALWRTHHVTADGWSLGAVFVPELTRLYTAFVEGRPSPLPELPVQYADYAVWQREWLRGEMLAEQLGYWRRQLAGLAPLELPADRPRPPAPSGRGGSRSWELPAGPADALSRLARAADATLFMALFATFSAVLHRETGAVEVPVGMPVANRSRSEVEGLIGFFVNTLVLRGNLAGDPDLPALLARSRDTVLGALSHQDIPFERLVDELALPRNPHRPPLLRVTFQFQTASAAGSLDLPGLTLTPFAAGIEVAKFDLVLDLFEAAGSVAGALRYDSDLFEDSTIARLSGHFTTLLEAWVDEPGTRISDLPLLTAAERHQLIVEWNPGPALPDRGRRCLHHLFETQVDRAPEALALSALTYGELDRRANRLARHLQASGVGPGDRVALLLERSSEMVVAILAVLKAGAAYVPLDPAYPAERLAFTLEDSGVSLLVTEGDRTLAAVRTVRLDAERDDIAGRSGERLEMPLDPELPAYVIYTSGSTGRPKGVVVTHASVGRLFTSTAPWFGFGAEDVWTLFHSYAFDFSVWELWGALLHGGRLVVVPYWESRSPEEFYRLVRDERVTVLNQTPSAFRQLLWAEEAVLHGGAPDLSLRWVIFGGEALEPASLAPWFARHGDERPRLVNMYGITETTVHVTWRAVRAADIRGGSLIGESIPDLAVHLLDAGLQPVPIGTPGEIHVGGAGLAQGYLNRPDLTAGRFVPDPFAGQPGARLYRSGDLARRLPDGDLEYLGRIDQQVKIRGFRIELGEIEAALAAQPGVREAVVLAREDRLVAYLSGEAADPAVLRQALAERLPDYMLPAAFVFLAALPLTENGKIDRPALPAPEAGGAATASRVPARDPLERFLAGQFRDVLGLPAEREIGIDEDFFELGGTSISSAIFTHRLQEALGEIVHIVTIFDHPTVSLLAGHVRERHAEAARRLEAGGEAAAVALERGVLVPIQAGSPGRRPFFLVHSVGGEVMAYFKLARLLGPDQPVYGLQSPDPPLEDVREMAALYAAALQEVQPRGPYRIAGWSMGGIVAFELARQLEAQGETTEILAVIDATAPGRWNAEPELRSADWMALFATALEQIYEVEIPPEVELPEVDLATLDLDAALGIALDLGRKVGLLSPTLEPAELRRLFERFRANRSSLRTYHGPYSYGGELHLFRATDGMTALAEDPTLGWGELLNGRVRIFDVPGDHRTIVKRGAATLAAHLRALLEQGD